MLIGYCIAPPLPVYYKKGGESLNVLKDNIRLYRQQKNWTQKQLGEKLGVSKTAVFYWEKGTREPDIKTIKKLCQLFGISPNDLYGADSEEDTSAHDFQRVCDWFEVVGLELESCDDYGNYSIIHPKKGEVGIMQKYDLINLCNQIIEQGEQLKEDFITDKLKLLFEK